VPAAPTGLNVTYGIKSYSFSWGAAAGATRYELFEDADGAGPALAAQIASTNGTTSHTVELPLLHERVNAQYSVRACNGAGCSALSATVQPDLRRAIGYLKASNTQADDHFGIAVAVSADGSTLAVGALNEDSGADGVNGDQSDNSQSAAGAVYVFVRANGTWTQQAYIKASNSRNPAAFGRSLTLSADGNTLGVGAPSENSGADGIDGNQADTSAQNAGAVYVFTRSAGAWSQQAYVKASASEAFDSFGWDVSLSADGQTLAVGAPGSNMAGRVYVFTRTSASWTQQAIVSASNANPGDAFGVSVRLSADASRMIVGAPMEASAASGVNANPFDNSRPGAGAAYVFRRSSGVWSQDAYLKASNATVARSFGVSVAISGDGLTVVVGAPGESSASTGINGSQLESGLTQAGAAYVFATNGAAWSQQAYVKASNTDAYDRFGDRVALSADGHRLAIAAPDERSAATGISGDQTDNSRAAGAVYVFGRSGSAWTQHGYLKASNTRGGSFGFGLSLSADGRTLASGDPLESSNAVGVQGDHDNGSAPGAGAVYLY